jgi:saccharopine dehydrogenase-like NADP-dependent oxidoreductase
VLAAAKHVPLVGAVATVLAGTGPVGQRAARLLARQGAEVRVASRSLEKAQQTCHSIAARVPGAKLTPLQTASAPETRAALDGAQIAIAAGAAGVELIPADVRRNCVSLQVAIDLNAVPPLGIAGVEDNLVLDAEEVFAIGQELAK